MDHPEISIQISDRIRGGELPSVVLRALLKEHPDCERRHKLGSYLIDAFDDSTLIHYAWRWKESKKSEAWDSEFDVLVIGHLLRKGVQVPWSGEFCETEWERIKPVLVADEEAEHKSNREEMRYERLLEKIREFTGELVCIEALWDGDTKGWYIWMSAVVQDSGSLVQKYLGTISFGGDIRVLRGIVPPWPEAIAASEVGSKLASTLGVEFYFPSPEKPDDSHPNWVDLWGPNQSLGAIKDICNCKNYSEVKGILPFPMDFFQGFEKLDSSSKLRAELFRCKECGQHWIVEMYREEDYSDSIYKPAFKIDDASSWLSHDTKSALAAWLIGRHGGLSDQKCIYARCTEIALKNMRVCVRHTYSQEYKW